MQLFQVKAMQVLRNKPSTARSERSDFTAMPDFSIKEFDEDHGEWRRVEVTDGAALTHEGYLKNSWLIEKAPPTLDEQIDEIGFVSNLTFFGRVFAVDRDYLTAVAWMESKIKNIVNPTTGAIGPFQFSESRWMGLVKEFGDQEKISLGDIVKPGPQGVFAAILTRDAKKRLDELSVDESVPIMVQLFLCYMLEVSAAEQLLAGDRSRKIDAALLDVYRHREDKDSFVGKILENRKRFLKTNGAVKTIDEVLKTIKEELEKGLEVAASIAAKLPDEGEQFLNVDENIFSSKVKGSIAKAKQEGREPYLLGFISAGYESAGLGVGTVSTGAGDPGGVSYGIHQLASKTGTLTRFLNSTDAADYAPEFADLAPGTGPFSNVYKEIAARDPKDFAKAQHDFIERTHYLPLKTRADELKINTDGRATKEALFSMSVQHGGAKKILSSFVSDFPDHGNMSEEERVNGLMKTRTAYVNGLSLDRGVEESLRERYVGERKDLVALSRAAA